MMPLAPTNQNVILDPDSSLCNRDITPTGLAERTWTTYNCIALWFSMLMEVTTFLLASSLIAGGMNWHEAVAVILLGNLTVLIPMIVGAHAGVKYGIPFPVLVRSSFGARGANIPAMLRALVACGWFGIQTWIAPNIRTLPTHHERGKRMTTRNPPFWSFVFRGTTSAICTLCLFAATVSSAQDSGDYRIRVDEPQQVIEGLGFEIQSDSIGSLNQGMPSEVVAVPHDLTRSERMRLYKHMLKGFRYARLALGLYLRGLDGDQMHIVERYPGQMKDLATMQRAAGIEGFDVEYWSPAPYWKSNKSFYGGTIAHSDPAFLERFSDAMVQDVRYLQDHGLHVSMWGLQNEPVFGMYPLTDDQGKQSVTKMPYGTCYYSPKDYAATLHYVVPKLRVLDPSLQIQVNSWDGPVGDYAAEIRKDPELLRNVDAWTWHQVGENSDTQIDAGEKYMRGAGGKPVYSNEFEYQPRDLKKIDSPFMNTGQSLMNWMVFENSPTWFWLHALKPVTNLEATGYALGFWRPYGELKTNLRPNLKPGHWEFNPQNYNALAGFLKYLAWDSTRLAVDEATVRHDQRILVWKTKQGRLGIALSNRSKNPYTFHISVAGRYSLQGHRYTVTSLDAPLGSKAGGAVSITVPPQAFEFWIER